MGDLKTKSLLYWILLGSQRRKVLKNFPEKPITAEELRKIINDKTPLRLSLREISRHLTSFAEKGLIKCLNPDAPYNRYYSITAIGEKIRKQISNY